MGEDNRLSLGGVSDKALSKFLEENKQIEEIVLFLDNDEVGIEASKKIAEKYRNDYRVKIFHSREEKDINETLIKIKEKLEIDKNINIKDFFIRVKSPFVMPKLQDRSKLVEYLENHCANKEFNNLLKQDLLGLTQDDKLILFVKDEAGENIGGYKFSLNDYRYENVKLLEGSSNNPVIIHSLYDGYKDDKPLLVMDNVMGNICFNKGNTAYINDFGNTSHIKQILELSKYTKFIFCIDEDNEERYSTFLNNLGKLKDEYKDVQIDIESMPWGLLYEKEVEQDLEL